MSLVEELEKYIKEYFSPRRLNVEVLDGFDELIEYLDNQKF